MSETNQRSEPGKHVFLGVVAGCMAQLLWLYELSASKHIIRQDVLRWATVLEWRTSSVSSTLLLLLAAYPEFRNLFYYRLSSECLSLKMLAQPFKLIYRE